MPQQQRPRLRSGTRLVGWGRGGMGEEEKKGVPGGVGIGKVKV